MSAEYDLYLKNHKDGVKECYEWIKANLPNMIPNDQALDMEHQICFAHDASKTKQDEYDAYDRYFYGNNRSYDVVENFNKAWLLHLHRNPHHWQYWILINDDPVNGEQVLDMPYNYILEMICDWWSFSFAQGNPYEIFDWYEGRKDYIKLSESTRSILECVLLNIKTKLDEYSLYAE